MLTAVSVTSWTPIAMHKPIRKNNNTEPQQFKAWMRGKQLPLWPEGIRCAPNEFLRSALFNARNRNQRRRYLRQETLAIIGSGRITYTGEELRQDDATVWLQLIQMARDTTLGSPRNWLRCFMASTSPTSSGLSANSCRKDCPPGCTAIWPVTNNHIHLPSKKSSALPISPSAATTISAGLSPRHWMSY